MGLLYRDPQGVGRALGVGGWGCAAPVFAPISRAHGVSLAISVHTALRPRPALRCWHVPPPQDLWSVTPGARPLHRLCEQVKLEEAQDKRLDFVLLPDSLFNCQWALPPAGHGVLTRWRSRAWWPSGLGPTVTLRDPPQICLTFCGQRNPDNLAPWPKYQLESWS